MDTIAGKRVELIAPYGIELTDLVAPPEERAELRSYADSLPSIRLTERSMCDLELLATGAFSPLDRFMNAADYRRVLDEMRLADGRIFPIPVTLPIEHGSAKEGQDVTLRNIKNEPIAVMRVDEIYPWDQSEFARRVLATESLAHPLVTEMQSWGELNASGPLRIMSPPRHFDFPELRLTPSETRLRLSSLGSANVVAFQTRNPLHRAHEEMTKRAIERTGGVLLLHPVVGLTKTGDVDHYSRVRTYKILSEKYYEEGRVLLALLPLAMRFAGPREALWHAVIRRNYGANYFIVGRDHASPGDDERGEPFYHPHAAQDLVKSFSRELEVEVISFEEFVYLPASDEYVERSEVTVGHTAVSLSGTKLRADHLDRGEPLPDWFARPEVSEILEETFPPRHLQGVCLWFTGLSASGKSTTAEILATMLASFGRRVTVLDGDVVRTHLSAGLGFDRAGREANIRRIGFVASEIVRHGGIAVCAAISPYRETRNEVRLMVGDNFVEVFVATPIDVCEQRDPKGLYARARRGEIADFTGIDSVYEPPENAEITLDTTMATAEENAQAIVQLLVERGFLRKDRGLGDDLGA